MIGMTRIENVIKLLLNDRGGIFNMAVRGPEIFYCDTIASLICGITSPIQSTIFFVFSIH
jgi:hypothetical protein